MKDSFDDRRITLLAQACDLDIPASCMEGVRSNILVLQHYISLIEGCELDAREEPAFEYHPDGA